jgi:hypothetical protein
MNPLPSNIIHLISKVCHSPYDIHFNIHILVLLFLNNFIFSLITPSKTLTSFNRKTLGKRNPFNTFAKNVNI